MPTVAATGVRVTVAVSGIAIRTPERDDPFIMRSPVGPSPSTARLLAGLLLAGGAAVAVLVGVGAAAGVPLGVLFRDAAASGTDALHAGEFYVGAGSTMTIVVWGASAALCAFVAWLWRDGQLAALGALTAVMCADDALQLHETVGPAVGVPELALPAAYGLGVLVVLGRYLRAGAHGPSAAVLVAVVLLGASVGVDLLDELLLHSSGGWVIVAEDGAKLLGALALTAVPLLGHAQHAAGARPGPVVEHSPAPVLAASR